MLKALLKHLVVALTSVALLAALVAGPERTREFFFPTPPVPGDWQALLAETRAFERRAGFVETANFKRKAESGGDHTICGYAPRFTLPYSYQDPLIRWSDARSERDCRVGAMGADVYFTRVEAVGESSTPMTATMVGGKLDRFLYLIIHEDCHDLFDFPYGFEEALCNLIAYRGLAQFARERYGNDTREARALRRYAQRQARLTHSVVAYYRQVEQLYARLARGEMAAEALLIERRRVFGAAERSLGWQRGTMNNVGLANEMTYSRHYPLLETVFGALGEDLGGAIAFFKTVDKLKPTPLMLMKARDIEDRHSVQFVRAYEAAVVATVKQAFAERARPRSARLK